MITIPTIIALAVVTPTIIPAIIKFRRFFSKRRTHVANITIKNRDNALEKGEGRDIEEYLDNCVDYQQLDEREEDVLEDDTLEYHEDCVTFTDGHRFGVREWIHEIRNGQSFLRERLVLSDRYEHTELITIGIPDIVEEDVEIIEKETTITVVDAPKTRHDVCVKDMLYDVLKAKYVVMEDTRESRRILRDHLVSWFDKRRHNDKDIRRQDMIRYIPDAVELFFVPNPYEIEAQRITDSQDAIRRHFEMSNPTRFQRCVYHVDSITWRRWYHTPRGSGSQ